MNTKIPTNSKPITKSTQGQNFSSKFANFIDNMMGFLEKKLKFVDDIIKSAFVKKVLDYKLVNDTNTAVRENLPTFTKVIGWIIVVFGGIGILTTLSTIRAAGFFLEYLGGFFFVLIILNLLYIAMSLILGYGFINMKKRVPFFITLIVILDLAYMVIAMAMSSFGSVPSPWMIIFYIIFTIYILKNKDIFTQ